MNRYNVANVITPRNLPRRYSNIKYPLIPPSSFDIYVYTVRGDRYDKLAFSYYNDSSLWWVILNSNPSEPRDSYYPNVGVQLRIPSPQRIPSIMADYKKFNTNV